MSVSIRPLATAVLLALSAAVLAPSAGHAPRLLAAGPAPDAVPLRAVGLPSGPSGPAACRPDVPGSLAAGAASDPTRVDMTATRRARGASGVMELTFASSPFGVSLAADGSYRYRVEVRVEDLRRRPGASYVVWAATPDLGRHVRLGTLGREGRVEGVVQWNKFLVFVTAEDTPEPEKWSQEILLSALSPSGRMHTMAGHGPFSGEPCLDPRP